MVEAVLSGNDAFPELDGNPGHKTSAVSEESSTSNGCNPSASSDVIDSPSIPKPGLDGSEYHGSTDETLCSGKDQELDDAPLDAISKAREQVVERSIPCISPSQDSGNPVDCVLRVPKSSRYSLRKAIPSRQIQCLCISRSRRALKRKRVM